MKLHEFLTKDNWTQNCDAKDIEGNPVCPNSDLAVKWCVAGALIKLLPEQSEELRRDWTKIYMRIGFLIEVNDTTDFETLHALLVELDI